MKRYMIIALVAVALAAGIFAASGRMVLGAAVPAPAVALAATSPQELGTPPTGWNSIEYISRIDQDGAYLTSYGYLTYISGLSAGAVFTDVYNTNERTARFTFYTTSVLTARTIISGVFQLNASGPTTFYYHPDGALADWASPATFAAGTSIATTSGRYQSVLNVQGPNLGLSTVFGEITHLTADPFTLGGQSYVLGRPGLLVREFFTGEGTRTDPITPKSFTVGAGNTVAVGQRGPYMPLILSEHP